MYTITLELFTNFNWPWLFIRRITTVLEVIDFSSRSVVKLMGEIKFSNSQFSLNLFFPTCLSNCFHDSTYFLGKSIDVKHCNMVFLKHNFEYLLKKKNSFYHVLPHELLDSTDNSTDKALLVQIKKNLLPSKLT